jgi:glycosyltransferase involved in cell wall biosynthesis
MIHIVLNAIYGNQIGKNIVNGPRRYKMHDPLVSVVIPTLPKRKKLLERAIQSVKNQTYDNIEIIAVTEGNNACEARNIGIERSNGKYIAFLDDDDEWLPTKIEKQIKMMEHETFQHINLCVTWILDKRFGMQRINKTPDVTNHDYVLKAFNLQSTSAYMFRSSILKEIGGFDESLPSAHEYDLALTISKKTPILSICEPLVIQNETEGQISENWTKKIKGILAIRKKHRSEYTFSHHAKAIGLVVVFSFGYIFGNKIYLLLNKVKERYQ